MTLEQRIRNLTPPTGPVDVVLDTDAYNEIDDQFALAYLLRNPQRLNTLAVYAAPFFNMNSSGPGDGMEKSYAEILKVLGLLGETRPVFRGSDRYLPDERTPVASPAAEDLVRRAGEHSPEDPLYVVAIGAITNVASALLMSPRSAENMVVVWLGGHAHHWPDTKEFNMVQDIAAARVVMGSGVPFVQLPCFGVVSGFHTSRPELEHWLKGKGPLGDYLVENTVQSAESYAKGTAWTRVIWDVTAVAWLLNDDGRFMQSRLVPTPLPTYDGMYTLTPESVPMRYVYHIDRDALFTDMFAALAE